MASKIEGFFGDGNNENQDFSNIDFTVNILSIVTKNDEMEDLLSKIMKDEKFESARKAKLSNQFGSVCLKANNFEKSGQLFGQAIQCFENFKVQTKEMEEFKTASFSNAWFNQANQFAGLKMYDHAI